MADAIKASGKAPREAPGDGSGKTAPVSLDDKYDLARSRIFVSGVQAVTRLLLMQKEMDRLFREYGLPWSLRSDNGTPFASTGAGEGVRSFV